MDSSHPPRFVVNRHRATTLHFDLRLEVPGPDGPVLASWAVPKGPSLDPAVKRLAVRVEDHDLGHLEVEGRDERESGRIDTKIVWDTGPYLPAVPPGPALATGHLRFVLAGHKLRGGFALTQTRMGGQDRNWLLVKVSDEHADPVRDPVREENRSVLSGLTNEDLADGLGAPLASMHRSPTAERHHSGRWRRCRRSTDTGTTLAPAPCPRTRLVTLSSPAIGGSRLSLDPPISDG